MALDGNRLGDDIKDKVLADPDSYRGGDAIEPIDGEELEALCRYIGQGVVDEIVTYGGSAGVTSFSGRSGAVAPTSGDYTAAQVGALAIDGSNSYTGITLTSSLGPRFVFYGHGLAIDGDNWYIRNQSSSFRAFFRPGDNRGDFCCYGGTSKFNVVLHVGTGWGAFGVNRSTSPTEPKFTDDADNWHTLAYADDIPLFADFQVAHPGGGSIGATYATLVNWSAASVVDGGFSFDPATGELTAAVAGRLALTCHAVVSAFASFGNEVRMKLQADTGSGFADLPSAYDHQSAPSVQVGRYIVDASVGHRFRVQMQSVGVAPTLTFARLSCELRS